MPPIITSTVSQGAMAGYTANEGSFGYDVLLSDGDDITSVICAFDKTGHAPASSTFLSRGTIMHYAIPAGPPAKAWIPAAIADANAILAMDVDLTVAAPVVQLYLSGKVKADALIYPLALQGSEEAANDNLRKNGILVESVLSNTGKVYRYTVAATPPARVANQADLPVGAGPDKDSLVDPPKHPFEGAPDAEPKEGEKLKGDLPHATKIEPPILAPKGEHHGRDPHHQEHKK